MKDGNIRKTLDKLFSDRLPPFFQLVRQSTHIDADKYAWPCLPYVGEEFETGLHPRILFVGKASGAWDDRSEVNLSKDYGTLAECLQRSIEASDLLELSDRCIVQRVLPFYAGRPRGWPLGSPFWGRCYKLAVRTFRRNISMLCPRHPELSTECFKGIAWTQVFKVGAKCGNPDGKMIDFLSKNLNTLKEEIECIRPEIVVFSTGPTYDGFLEKYLNAKVIAPRDRVSVVQGLPACIKCAFRTWHFQRLRNDELTSIVQMMISHMLP